MRQALRLSLLSCMTASDYSHIAENLRAIHDLISVACKRNGRKPEDVQLVAVSKTFPVEAIRAAYAAGQRLFGENRVQEAESKITSLQSELPDIRWHLIGHLQSNKAKKAAGLFDMIESVDSLKLAADLSKRCQSSGKVMPVLLEINSSGELQKHGVSFSEAPKIAHEISELPGLSLKGLMTIGPLTESQSEVRRAFSKTRELWEKLSAMGCFSRGKKSVLSMGMSGDFELAIAEGSTLIRIGTGIFGSRPRK